MALDVSSLKFKVQCSKGKVKCLKLNVQRAKYPPVFLLPRYSTLPSERSFAIVLATVARLFFVLATSPNSDIPGLFFIVSFIVSLIVSFIVSFSGALMASLIGAPEIPHNLRCRHKIPPQANSH